MTDRQRSVALLLAAAMLLVGGVAHAFMGLRVVREVTGAAQGVGLTGSLGAGWQLGSVSLLTFGVLALAGGLARWRGQPVAPPTLRIVAISLAGFGVGAVLLGDRTYLHFYFSYIVIGALLALGEARRSDIAVERPDVVAPAKPLGVPGAGPDASLPLRSYGHQHKLP